MTATEELFDDLLDALERAGVDRERVQRSTLFGSCLIESADVNRALTFRLDPWGYERGRLRPWVWSVWGGARFGDPANTRELARGREKDVASMVARVAAFLGTGKP